MLKINLKIFLVHILCCGLCYWSFTWDWIDHNTVLLMAFSGFVLLSYIAAGFWANSDDHKGAWPIVSLFVLGLVLILINIPVMIDEFSIFPSELKDQIFLVSNLSFIRFFFCDPNLISRFLQLFPNNTPFIGVVLILALLPSTLAMIGYFLREPLHRKKRKAAQVEDLDLT